MSAQPSCSSCARACASVSAVSKPGIDSSLSSVPPVCPSPRPDIIGTPTPSDETSGASTIETLSPTPPVECLSMRGLPRSRRSSVSPLRSIASVSACVSSRDRARGGSTPSGTRPSDSRARGRWHTRWRARGTPPPRCGRRPASARSAEARALSGLWGIHSMTARPRLAADPRRRPPRRPVAHLHPGVSSCSCLSRCRVA